MINHDDPQEIESAALIEKLLTEDQRQWDFTAKSRAILTIFIDNLQTCQSMQDEHLTKELL